MDTKRETKKKDTKMPKRALKDRTEPERIVKKEVDQKGRVPKKWLKGPTERAEQELKKERTEPQIESPRGEGPKKRVQMPRM